MKTITIMTMAGATLVLRPVPMPSMPSENPAHWIKFQGSHVPGTTMSEEEMQRMQTFMKQQKTEALTDGNQNFTLAGGMLAYCDPTAV